MYFLFLGSLANNHLILDPVCERGNASILFMARTPIKGAVIFNAYSSHTPRSVFSGPWEYRSNYRESNITVPKEDRAFSGHRC